MSFIQIDEQIEREIRCIDDLTAVINLHVKAGRINIAKQLEQDLHNSLDQLEKHYRRKKLWSTADGLNLQGKKAKVVKKVVEMA